METITYEEQLMAIYNTGTREGTIAELAQMRGQLEADEVELMTMTDSALKKLRAMSDEDFAALDLIPNFDEV